MEPAKSVDADRLRSGWAQSPVIYEINTWVWLHELGVRLGRPLDLKSVPDAEWDHLASLSIDAVWFMGVWRRSPAGIAVALRNGYLVEEFRSALPDFMEQDVVGSPYCVRDYQVDERLGGAKGLAAARAKLADRGVKLILDFVPNHVAPDHPWVAAHPEFFVQGSQDDLKWHPNSFVEIGDRIFAYGRDPNCSPWTDVLQVNVFHPFLREEAAATVAHIAESCDGIRCDMAMLVMNDIFEKTWAIHAGRRPEVEYWPTIIEAARKVNPECLFIAEAYWDLEWKLQRQGFDYCYDKRLYDRLAHDCAENVRLHLTAGVDYQSKLVRFVENHDEPRACAYFGADRGHAAAVAAATLPGAKLFHEGQFEGRKIKTPVFLGRRPEEFADEEMRAFYGRLLSALRALPLREGEWRLIGRSGWPDNQSFLNLVTWSWTRKDKVAVVAVNLSGSPAQAMVDIPLDSHFSGMITLRDVFTGARYERGVDAIRAAGLYIDLPPWGYHLLLND